MLAVLLLALTLFGPRIALEPEPDAGPVVTEAATPAPTPLPKDVFEAATTAGYADIADELDQAALGVATIRAAYNAWPPEELGTSRFGGDPDLPTQETWPQCEGRPQTFLGQVRASDLPPEAKELRKHKGTLLFFTHVEFEPGETTHGLWAGDCSTVIHAPAGTKLRRQNAPRDGVLELRAAPMRFTGRYDVPDLALDDDHLMPPLQDITIPDWEAWWDFRAGLRNDDYPTHMLLGYPSAPNGGDDCSERAEQSRDTWRHLFTAEYDEDLGFMVADGGRLQLLIAPEDLRRGRFDRVCGTFDSG